MTPTVWAEESTDTRSQDPVSPCFSVFLLQPHAPNPLDRQTRHQLSLLSASVYQSSGRAGEGLLLPVAVLGTILGTPSNAVTRLCQAGAGATTGRSEESSRTLQLWAGLKAR